MYIYTKKKSNEREFMLPRSRYRYIISGHVFRFPIYSVPLSASALLSRPLYCPNVTASMDIRSSEHRALDVTSTRPRARPREVLQDRRQNLIATFYKVQNAQANYKHYTYEIQLQQITPVHTTKNETMYIYM